MGQQAGWLCRSQTPLSCLKQMLTWHDLQAPRQTFSRLGSGTVWGVSDSFTLLPVLCASPIPPGPPADAEQGRTRKQKATDLACCKKQSARDSSFREISTHLPGLRLPLMSRSSLTGCSVTFDSASLSVHWDQTPGSAARASRQLL